MAAVPYRIFFLFFFFVFNICHFGTGTNLFPSSSSPHFHIFRSHISALTHMENISTDSLHFLFVNMSRTFRFSLRLFTIESTSSEHFFSVDFSTHVDENAGVGQCGFLGLGKRLIVQLDDGPFAYYTDQCT